MSDFSKESIQRAKESKVTKINIKYTRRKIRYTSKNREMVKRRLLKRLFENAYSINKEPFIYFLFN